MNREEFEKSNKGVLEDFNGHKNLLVSFGGIQQGLGIPVFEFFNSISDIPCDKLFLRDFGQAWYQKGVDSKLDHIDEVINYIKDKITENKYDKICFLGNSMGGYAAILFGSIMNVDTVISFAPQTFIDRFHRKIYRDKRWQDQINKVYAFEKKRKDFFDLKKYLKKNRSYKTQINIFYSPKDILDKKHAERLKTLNHIILNPIQEGGHEVVKVLRNNGELRSLIKTSFE
ncbi:MAG: hypothetical protein H6600_05200 [Flavobacteriales bacterium]|nr:hypothetical protein [Flavobacteriales bacterium]